MITIKQNLLFFLSLLTSLTFLPFATLLSAQSSQYKVKHAKESLPIVFQKLINTISAYDLNEIEEKRYLNTITKLDYNFKYIIPSTVLYNYIQIHIHKSVLEKYPKQALLIFPSQKMFLKSIASMKPDLKIASPFSKWILRKLKADLKTLVSSPHYKSLITSLRNRAQIRDTELLSIKKRIEILLPWYQIFKVKSPHYIEETIRPFLFLILDKLLELTELHLKVSSFDIIDEKIVLSNKLNFFTLQLKKKTKTLTTDNFLKDNQKIQEFDDLPIAVNDWVPRDDQLTPDDSSDEEYDFFGTFDPNYITPTDLPQKVDDWVNENESKNIFEYFPKPGPNYKAPKNLPSPTKEWLPK